MTFLMMVIGLATALPTGGPVRPGLEVLISDSLHLVTGKRVGLVTNHAGVDRQGRHAVDVLRAAGVNLTALFSPEHGFRGAAAPGETIAFAVDSATGIPIYSLYGRTTAPTDSMLATVDVILIDLPDVGTRYYTYPSTTIAVMKAAAKVGKRVIVLDRPDPIGGVVQGNVLEPAFRTFVGSLAVPMRHGMTLGELARFAIVELSLENNLSVVPTSGWTRDVDALHTGLPFLAPSPNLQSIESLFHYPGTCLFEGTALSVGRGSDAGYRQVGAPWLDTTAVLRIVRRAKVPGVEFASVTFTPVRPGDGKFADTTLAGIRLTVTDHRRYDPTLAGVVLLDAVRRVHPDRIGFIVAHFDRLAGSRHLRESLLAGRSVKAIVRSWKPAVDRFLLRRRASLIYS